MRITKQDLIRRWLVTTLLAAAVFAVLAASDQRLKAMSGFGTADLQTFNSAAQYRAALFVWGHGTYGLWAGFCLGLDYLLMPLYALAFFFSAIVAREGFGARSPRIRRILTILAAVPIAGAFLDGLENLLELILLLGRPSDGLAGIAHTVSGAKWVALYVGILLLAGALMVWVAERQQRRLARKGRQDGL